MLPLQSTTMVINYQYHHFRTITDHHFHDQTNYHLQLLSSFITIPTIKLAATINYHHHPSLWPQSNQPLSSTTIVNNQHFHHQSPILHSFHLSPSLTTIHHQLGTITIIFIYVLEKLHSCERNTGRGAYKLRIHSDDDHHEGDISVIFSMFHNYIAISFYWNILMNIENEGCKTI